MSFCEDCGKSLREVARFCWSCGANVPDDEAAAQAVAAPPEPASSWACPSCGTANDAEALFCSRCGLGRGVHAPVAIDREATTTVATPSAIAADQPTVPIPTAEIERGPAGVVEGGSTGSSRVSRRTLIIALAAAVGLVLLAVVAFVIVAHNNADGQK